MNQLQIKATQQRIKDLHDSTLVVDGFWGPKSTTACQSYLRSLMPTKNPWPGTSQAELMAFYGAAGDESKLTNLAVDGLGLRYEGIPVRTVRCHSKVAPSLFRIYSELSLTDFGRTFLADYNGCFNDRPMRGGTLPSLHARGAAVDHLAGFNSNHSHWPAKATMDLRIMEVFSREGWLSAGAFWSRDAMHFQATK